MSGSSSIASSAEVPAAAAVIVAGGSGRRMGGVRKQYLDLLGQPVLLRAIRPFLAHPRIVSVVVVLPEEDLTDPPGWLKTLPVVLTAGGEHRGDSVWNGLARLGEGIEIVIVHDAARPFVTTEVIDRVLLGARSGGAIAAVPATDTIKEVGPDHRVVRTLPRARIWQAQTPQGFPLSELKRCHLRAREAAWEETDDAALFERCALPVLVVEGSAENIKITRPADLPIAEAIARRAAERAERGAYPER